jgi:hypothetical protein
MYEKICKNVDCNKPYQSPKPGSKYCPACMGVKTNQPVLTMYSAEQVQAMLAEREQQQANTLKQLLDAQAENTRLLITELRKPSDEEVAKKEKEAARLKEQTRMRIEAHRIEDEARARFVGACAANGHRNEKGRVVISGQTMTGTGKFQPMCVRCCSLLTPIDAPDPMLGAGSGMGFGSPETVQA